MLNGYLYLLFFVLSILFLIPLFRQTESRLSRHLVRTTLLVAFWNLMKGLSFFISDPEVILVLQELKYISVTLISPFYLIATLIFIRVYNRIHPYFIKSLFIIPAVSLISIFTHGFPYTFFSGERIHWLDNGMPIFSYTREIGFYISALYAYILMLTVGILLLVRAIRVPKIYRTQTLFVLIGTSVSTIINLLYVSKVIGTMRMDTTPISSLFSVIILYIGMYRLPKQMIVPYARNLIIENLKEAVVVIDNDGALLDINPAAQTFINCYSTHYHIAEDISHMVGTYFIDLIKSIPQLGYHDEPLQEQDGRILELVTSNTNKFYRVSIEPVADDSHLKIGSVITLHDITESQEQLNKLIAANNDIHQLAYYDQLTKTPNRTLFYDRIRTAVTRSKRRNTNVALFYLDIDNFKPVNDTFGHDAGDLLLIEVAGRIQSVIRKTDTLSRLGGDEFTVIFEDIQIPEDVEVMAVKIIDALESPITLYGHEISISASIGIALCPMDDLTAEGIIRKADTAMYHAKATGKNRYVFSSEELEKNHEEILKMKSKLKKALKNGEFQLFFQPQMDYINHGFTVVGGEALIRWQPSDGPMIPPDKFIPAAESSGQILAIGHWVIEETFRLNRRLREQNLFIQMSINISVKQFETGELLQQLTLLMGQNKDIGINLVVEITESMFINDLDNALAYLNAIKDLGIEIALDDFGTGYSSLGYLSRLPIDILKIDRTFVSQMKNTRQRNLTRSIISMARNLDILTVAEGVETIEQSLELIHNNCDLQQGYYFSKPVPFDEFIDFIKKENCKRHTNNTPSTHGQHIPSI